MVFFKVLLVLVSRYLNSSLSFLAQYQLLEYKVLILLWTWFSSQGFGWVKSQVTWAALRWNQLPVSWVLLPPQGALPPTVGHGTRGVGLQLRRGMSTQIVPIRSSKGLCKGFVLFESHRPFESTLSDFGSQSAQHLRVESLPLGPRFLPTQVFWSCPFNRKTIRQFGYGFPRNPIEWIKGYHLCVFGGLLSARLYNYFIWITSQHCRNTLIKQVLVWRPWYTGRNWDSQRFNNLPKITELVRVRVWIRTPNPPSKPLSQAPWDVSHPGRSRWGHFGDHSPGECFLSMSYPRNGIARWNLGHSVQVEFQINNK